MNTPQLACQTKVQYESWRNAMARASRVRDRTGRRLDVYRCRYCSYFHCASSGDGVQPRQLRMAPAERWQPVSMWFATEEED